MSEAITNFKEEHLSQVDEIFFESSSKKDFKDAQEKKDFNWKYLGFYLTHYPEFAWIYLKDQKVLGYILGMPDSANPTLYQIQPHMQAFENDFKMYPAHLHINCHFESRGQGVGQKLVSHCLEQMRRKSIGGLHIMTGPASQNRSFYRKLGFQYEVTHNSILLMGILLK